MTPASQGKSEMIITIDNASMNVDVKLRSLAHLRVSFIGACTIAQSLVLDMLRQDGNLDQATDKITGLATPPSNSYNQDKDKVTKQEAIDHYSEVMMNLQQRIKTIRESDDRATFYINAAIDNV